MPGNLKDAPTLAYREPHSKWSDSYCFKPFKDMSVQLLDNHEVNRDFTSHTCKNTDFEELV